MTRPLILFRFLDIFIHYYWPFMCELLYPYQTFTDCKFNQYWYVKMLDVTAGYGILLHFCEYCTKFTNIHVCVLASPNIHILYIWCEYKYCVLIKCHMWLKVMERSLNLLTLFLDIFYTFLMAIHVWSIVSSPNFHILYVLFIHTFWCQHARCNFKLWKFLWFNWVL